MPTEREIHKKLLGSPTKTIDDLLTIGMLHYHKWKEIENWENNNGNKEIDLEKFKEISDSFIDERIGLFADAADKIIIEYKKKTIDEFTSYQRKSWFGGIIQNIIASFLYSIILVAALLIIRENDIDILKFFRPETKQTTDSIENSHSPQPR